MEQRDVRRNAERAGGRFPTGSEDNWKGHDLPGQGPGGLGGCMVCHDPHGNTNYRNLRALDGSQEAPVAYVNPAATGLDKYRRSNVGYAKKLRRQAVRRVPFAVSSATDFASASAVSADNEVFCLSWSPAARC